ncbi:MULTISPECIES: ECF transporter S component [Bacillus]|uniref:ECF transporter S component n=1 Tax=Bacillus TaxID=1386 RepID=UPI0002E41D72|nr:MULTISPECIES: ECF transporter S component [Bacillus]
MKIQKTTICALLIAMCFIGANIKVMGSIAFDAAPAFIGTLLLGPGFGMALGFLGHMISSLIAGFPLSFPVHLIIAIMMAITMFLYSVTRRWIGKKINQAFGIGISVVIAFIFNCPLSLLALYPILKDVIFVLFPALAIASVCNIVVAEIVFAALPLKWKKKYISPSTI